MGRPPSHGDRSFSFSSTEVNQMEAILQAYKTAMPAREVLVALAEKFSSSAERSGKFVVQMKQVWNWFQNRRYAIRAKTAKSPGKFSSPPVPQRDPAAVTPAKLSASSLPQSDPAAVRIMPQAPQPIPTPQAAVKTMPQAPQSLPAASASSDSMALMGNANGADWQAEIYQKIMSMKQIYLPELNDLYQRVAFKMQQGNDTCASETPAMGSGRQGISCDFDWLDGSFDGLGSGWNGACISGISTSGLDRLGSSSDAKLSERLGLVEEQLEKIEARLEKVDTWLVDINKRLNNLVKIKDVKVSSYSWTSDGRAKRKHRVAEIIRKSCRRRRLRKGAVKVVSPVALRDDCDEDVQRKSDEEQKY